MCGIPPEVAFVSAHPAREDYPSSCAATSWRRNATSSSGAISVAKPAAWRCPPPLWARAISETSTAPSVARSDTFDAPRAVVSRQLAGERGDLRALHRAQVVDDPLGVGLLGARLGEVVARQARERQAAVVEALHAAQRAREQRELGLGHAFVQAPVDLVHVDAGLDQVGGHDMRGGAGVLVHEAPRVGDEADVERLGHLLRERDVERAREVPHDLRGARRLGHDVVDRAELRVVVMVVEVEDRRVADLDGVAVEVAAVQEDDRALARRPSGMSLTSPSNSKNPYS